ncbi:glycosyltransferase family 4 protein [Calderihabitans maritimus]|uniref:Group 1 glycosyl transferase n=1 Tax=Calderihabitans maritimus TaxID=1246530 RepID=A0A1Z5HWW4_9FIRM|nr:glycosyltransferase family 4 protein [Calderihabitans maritimus]GAW94022.1 hypothetical protein KKC1_31410 [Calderihabitans maritimus]
MNILVLSDAFWPDHTGGISKSLLSEVEGLVTRGHRVVVVTRRLNRDTASYEERDGYKLYRYASPSKGTIFYRLYPLASLVQTPKLVARLHKKFLFDIAYVHNAFQAVGISRCGEQVPYVYVFHAPTPREIEIEAAKGKYGWSTPLLKPVNQWIKVQERQALAQARAIVVRSEYMKKEMHQFYGEVGKDKTFQVPLGVDTRRFSFVDDPRAVRRELALPLDRPILLSVRRLVARMGLENLITAMRYVVKQIPDALLLIGGKGYLETSLRAQVRQFHLESNVQFLGFISEEKLPKYYQAADLFVLPTTMLEGFGLSTIESLSCGTPVLATPVGANPEVVGPLGSEFLCKDTTADSLAERIIWWLDRRASTEVRQTCREYCASNFDLDTITVFLENIFNQAITREGVTR